MEFGTAKSKHQAGCERDVYRAPRRKGRQNKGSYSKATVSSSAHLGTSAGQGAGEQDAVQLPSVGCQS